MISKLKLEIDSFKKGIEEKESQSVDNQSF